MFYPKYAPDAPWDDTETLNIFRQTIRQLANLAHTTQPSQANFDCYSRILELLAEVKIGVVLVDLTKHDNHQAQQEALQVLAELFRTILQSVRLEHPPEIAEMTQKTISACLEEYYEGVAIPIPLLDELLVCIGQGPTVLVATAQPVEPSRRRQQLQLNPNQIEQANPSYLVAASVVRKTVDRLSTPIANLLNGLLNGDPHTVEESCILTTPPPLESLMTGTTSRPFARPQAQDQSPVANVWSIVYEFHKIAPAILTTVIGTVANFLTTPESGKRLLVVQLMGSLFTANNANLANNFRPCFRQWLKRAKDIDPAVRRTMVDYLIPLLQIASATTTSDSNELYHETEQALMGLVEDTGVEVRLHAIHQITDVAYRNSTVVSSKLLQMVGTKVFSKNKQERRKS